MIDRMAGKIAQWNKGILKLSEEESKVVEYGISVFLDSVFKFLVLLFISILIGKEIEFGLCLFSFCGLRYWAGGIHCSTRERCLIAMIVLCFITLWTSLIKEAEYGEDVAYLKLFDGRDWKWFQVKLLHTDMEYLRKKWSGKKATAPTLEKKHHTYFLRFSYTEEVSLSKTAVKEQVICSVDLGINTDAVCSSMRTDGTILGRKFINFTSDKDHLYHVLGRIRRFQREHSSGEVQSRWNYAKRLNMELSRKIAAAITKCAIEYQADVIVFEYLEMQGKLSGKKKQKLHLWRKRDIQKLCEHQAHRNGIRVSRVSAQNTSRLACDGSGAVVRNPENHSLCTFRTGKQYNCDLSASYNIGARYFIRELLKPLPETERSSLEAKVPAVKRRTSCVYADLRKLYAEISELKAA